MIHGKEQNHVGSAIEISQPKFRFHREHQLKGELQKKTNKLETLKEHIEAKRQQPSTESIGQAMQLQAMLNEKLEEMLNENDLLKKSIQDLEYFAQQERSERSINTDDTSFVFYSRMDEGKKTF